jgi:hypothetical protein
MHRKSRYAIDKATLSFFIMLDKRGSYYYGILARSAVMTHRAFDDSALEILSTSPRRTPGHPFDRAGRGGAGLAARERFRCPKPFCARPCGA